MWESFKLDSIKNLIRISFKGFSQVMLIDNAISGGLILLGIMLHSPLLGLMALLSSMIGTLTGKYCGGDQIAVSHGIYGFNAILSGIAVMLFSQNDWNWIIALFAAIAAGMNLILYPNGLPVLTSPFIISTWLFLAMRRTIPIFEPQITEKQQEHT